MKKKDRVIVGMSGGVDSCVAAALLVEKGYDVIGVTIKTYEYSKVGGNLGNDSSCCSLDGINDARKVCIELGIPHYVLDFSQQFKLCVIEPFIKEYLEGHTPNPCVLCNSKIKWEYLLNKGQSLGADYVAMGHYANIKFNNATQRFWVSRGRDWIKDQSYALWAISQENIRRTLFPLGEMTKEETRVYAEKMGIHTAAKRESFEICFIPDNDYSRFLKEQIPDLEARVMNGEIVYDGNVIGKHDGYPFYTIGQRRGLNIAIGEPVYVTQIDETHNRITVGRNEDLYHCRFDTHSVCMQKYPFPETEMRVIAKIRYRDEGAPATLIPLGNGELHVLFHKSRRAITPGQSTVWYEGDDIVGGGIIKSILE